MPVNKSRLEDHCDSPRAITKTKTIEIKAPQLAKRKPRLAPKLKYKPIKAPSAAPPLIPIM